MRPEDVREHVAKQPFEPIRLRVSSGGHVDILHPEMAIVAKSLVAVGVGENGGVADHIVHFNLLHVVKIEPLNGTSGGGREDGRRNR